jgi:hypothetical protein
MSVLDELAYKDKGGIPDEPCERIGGTESARSLSARRPPQPDVSSVESRPCPGITAKMGHAQQFTCGRL